MIVARFFKSSKDFEGFEISGHSGFAEQGKDIVCAAVSSAALLICNILTEEFKTECNATQSDGYLLLTVKEHSDASNGLIKSLYLHLKDISKQYPQYLKIIYGGKAKCLK